MSMMKKIAIAAAGLLAAASLSLANAQSDPVLQQARAQGVVGEMYTGYLGVADDGKASADIKRRVDEVNAKRLQIYTESAKENGQSVQVIAALTAEKQIARAGAGEAVKPGASEGWKKKP